MSSKNANPQAGQGIPLPKKETDLFRTVVKQYECKQYKKGMKAADQILKKFPNHGETLCMKGLILNCQGKKDEAISMVKLGLMNDMRSHVCWHVYGLIYRSERNYNEAIKAYKQALRIDKDNIQILKDLGLLQIQMRDLEGFTKTQHAILELKPNLKVNWLAFALGKHMNGDFDGAIEVIDIFLGTLEEDSPDLKKSYETSELALYKNSIIAETGDWQKALDHLKECNEKDILVDRLAYLKLTGHYQLQLGQFDEGKETFMQLFERGSTEDYSVHTGYMLSILKIGGDIAKSMLYRKGARALSSMMNLDQSQKDVLRKEYESNLSTIFGRSIATKRIILTLLDPTSEEFTSAADKYIRANIMRGVPSLGDDLSSLFIMPSETNESEMDIAKDAVDIKNNAAYQKISSLVDGYIASLEASSTFPDEEESQPPSTLLWTWYLRSVLHELCGEYKEAINFADKSIEQTPTGVDIYELKGRLLKGAGDINAAVKCLDEGRELDKQDRYINNQTTKYLLQANNEKEALEKMALFTRHENDPEQNIFDMQVTWYELELAACYGRKKNFGRCLKSYLAVEKHFEDIHEDQFDFHAYCIRKVTLRAYADVLRWEDKLWGNDTYVKAAEGAIRTYLYLHDNPVKVEDDSEPDYSKMTAAERKKAKAIARKKKLKAEKEAAAKKDDAKSTDKENSNKKKKDDDPNGDKLLSKVPLDEAKKYAATLVKNAANCLTTWLCQYDVCVKRGKAMMALQALFKAKSLGASNESAISSELFKRIVAFHEDVSLGESAKSVVKDVFESEKAKLLGDSKSLNDYVNDWARKIKSNARTDLSLRTEVARAMVKCNPGSAKDAISLIVENGLDIRGVDIDSCKNAVEVLKSIDDKATETQDFVDIVKGKYHLASIF